MSFTDGKPRVATEEDIRAPWSGGKKGKYFRCKLCGRKFQVGDYWRFIFHEYGNILVCEDCDTDSPVDRWTQIHKEWAELREGRLWWFIVRLEDELADLERETAYELRDLRADADYWKDKTLYRES